MSRTIARFAIPSVLVVLLAGCSGKSSYLEPGDPMASQTALTHEQVQDIHEAAEASATAQPEFGSVVQTIQDNIDGISASFDAETHDVVVTISRDDGTELVIGTSQDHDIAYSYELGEGSRIDPRRGIDTRLENYTSRDLEPGGVLKARVITSWDPNDLGDWVTGGYWAYVTYDSTEVGAFVDGPEFDAAPTLPATGSASYLGLAGGLFTADLGSDYAEGSYASGEYDGRIQLLIAFDIGPDNSAVMHGSIHDLFLGGELVDHRGGTTTYGDVDRLRYVELQLRDGLLNAEGEATGPISAHGGDVTSSEGAWGAVVSSEQDSNGDPRAIAGTHGAIIYTADGSEFTLMGAHFAHSETRLFSDDAP